MRATILEAVRSGKLEDLRLAVELNEIRPVIGGGDARDAMDGLKQQAKLQPEVDLLAMIGKLLASRWVAVPLGPDPENNRIYVWPRFAEAGIKELTESEGAELKALVPAAALASMRERGIYDYWRIGIGADGTWHFLRQ